MASITSVDFTAEFQLDNATKQIILTDTTDYVGQGIIGGDGPAGIITATGPAGIFYSNTNFGDADVPAPLTSPTSTKTIALPIDGSGNILQGTYSVKYTVKLVTGDSSQAEKTTVKSINYTKPVADVEMTVNLGAPLLTSDDLTDYTIDLITPSIVYDHDIFYPASLSVDPIQGASKIVTTNVIFIVAGQVLAYTSTVVATTTYDYGDGITVTDEVTGNGQIDIDGDATVCQLYCCMRAAFNRYLRESTTDSRRAQETLEQLNEASSLLLLLDVSIRCGKTEDTNDYALQIKEVLDCNDDCECGDEPQLVIGSGSTFGMVVVDEGPGITVVSVSGGGLTTYTVSMQSDLLDKLNASFNTTLIQGTDITISSVVDGSGNIAYTINADSQIQTATQVLISAIVGLSAANVQDALQELKDLIDVNIADIATNLGNITTNTSDIATNVTNIGTNTTNIATNVTNIGTNTTDIATNDGNITTNTSDIATNVTNIGTNTTNIATNVTNIGTNTTAISDLQVEAWIDVDTFNAGWDNDNDTSITQLQYRKDPQGVLHLKGGVRNSGTPAGSTIFVLPSSHRPIDTTFVSGFDDANDTYHGVEMNADGSVTVIGALEAAMRFHIVGGSVRST